jgi:DedD protein
VPVAPKKEVSQPVTPTENLPEPPAPEKAEAAVEAPPPPSVESQPAAVVEVKPEPAAESRSVVTAKPEPPPAWPDASAESRYPAAGGRRAGSDDGTVQSAAGSQGGAG